MAWGHLDLVETLTWGGVEDTARRRGECAHVRCRRVSIRSGRNGRGGCCGAIGAAGAVRRGGATAVATTRTDAAWLCTLIVILRPLATAVLHAHSQLTCVGVEAGGATRWSAAARRALDTLALHTGFLGLGRHLPGHGVQRLYKIRSTL